MRKYVIDNMHYVNSLIHSVFVRKAYTPTFITLVGLFVVYMICVTKIFRKGLQPFKLICIRHRYIKLICAAHYCKL